MSIDIGRLNPDQRRAMDSQTIRQLETRAKAAEARETELRSLVGPEALSHRLALEARVAELEEAIRRIYRDRGERDKVFMEATRVMPDLARFRTLRDEVAAKGDEAK